MLRPALSELRSALSETPRSQDLNDCVVGAVFDLSALERYLPEQFSALTSDVLRTDQARRRIRGCVQHHQ